MRKIDIFTHIYPPAFYEAVERVAGDFKDVGKRSRGVPMLYDLDERFRVMDRFQDYQQILSLPTPPLEVMGTPAQAIDLARLANDGMAELVGSTRIDSPGFVASLPLNDARRGGGETQRAVDDLGASGIQIFSNVKGKPLVRAGVPADLRDDGRLRPADLAAPVSRARTSRLPDRGGIGVRDLVDVRLAVRHQRGDGAHRVRGPLRSLSDSEDHRAPHGRDGAVFAGRVGPGWDQLGVRTSDQDLSLVLKQLKKRPFDYFKMFYADTALFGAYDATVCGLGFFGVDHVLFASDAPFDPEKGPMYIRETIAIVDRLPISADERERIYWRNAVELLKLEV